MNKGVEAGVELYIFYCHIKASLHCTYFIINCFSQKEFCINYVLL